MSKVKEICFWLKIIVVKIRHFTTYYNFKDSDSSSVESVQLKSFNASKRLVEFAYNKIPFYRKYYNESGFHPSHLIEPSDWSKVPIIEKSHVRNFHNDFCCQSITARFNRKVSSTGGSTGVPIKVYHDRRANLIANYWRILNWWGVPQGSDIAFVFRDRLGSKFKRLLNNIIWWPTKRLFLDASSATSDDISRFVKELVLYRPKIVQGYTGSLHEIALYIINNQVRISGVTAVWTTSSTLTNSVRADLERAFNAKVFDQYGSGEVYWIATECHIGSLHIHEDIRRVDIVNDQNQPVKDGEKGHLLITDLTNYVFPIIKYRNGDMAAISQSYCSCSLPYKHLSKIYGRCTDLIKLSDGGFISGDYFTTIFDDYADIVKLFQVRQISLNELVISVSFTTACFEAQQNIVNEVKACVLKKSKGLLQVIVVVDNDLSINVHGKNRYIVNEII